MSGRAPVIDTTQDIYPTATSAGTTVTAHASATSTYGDEVEIVAAGLVTSPFRVTGVQCDTPSAAGIYKVKVVKGASGSTTKIAETKAEVATDAGEVSPINLLGLSGAVLPASTRIAAAITGGSAATLNVSVGISEV